MGFYIRKIYMKIFKKLMALMIVHTFVMIIFSLNVFAEGGIKFHMSVDDQIKPGKSFELTVSAESTQNIGAAHFYVSYDREHIILKSVVLDDKNANHIMYYNDSDGYIDIIYADKTAGSNTVNFILKYQPVSSEDREYLFGGGFYDSCNENADSIFCDEFTGIQLTIGENGIESKVLNVISPTQSEEKSSSKSTSSKLERSSISVQSNIQPTERSSFYRKNSHIENTIDNNESEPTSENTQNDYTVSYINDEDSDKISRKDFYIFMGIAITVVCILIYVNKIKGNKKV